jgi:hypothetical protein
MIKSAQAAEKERRFVLYFLLLMLHCFLPAFSSSTSLYLAVSILHKVYRPSNSVGNNGVNVCTMNAIWQRRWTILETEIICHSGSHEKAMSV